jgi:hypothetical protein
VRAAFGIQALLGDAQALDGPSADEMLLDDGGGIGGLHVAVPDGFGVNHHSGAVLALVKAAGLVDAHLARKAGRLGELLQLGVQIALSIGSARRPRSIGGTGIMADENVVFKRGQAVILQDCDESRLRPLRAVFRPADAEVSTFLPAHPAASAKMVA